MTAHIIVTVTRENVYLSVDEHEVELAPEEAKAAGEALFKAGCDVEITTK